MPAAVAQTADPSLLHQAVELLTTAYNDIAGALDQDLLTGAVVIFVVVFLFYPRLLLQSHRSFLQRILWSAVICGVAVLAGIAWPVSGWLLAAYALHWVLCSLGERLGAAGNPHPARRVAAHVARALARSVAYVGLGIFLVAVAQALLRTGIVAVLAWVLAWEGAPDIDPGQVHQAVPAVLRRSEELLSVAYHRLMGVLSLEVLAIAMAVLVAIVLVQPRSRTLSHFLALRKAASKAALVLLGVTSFTFFGALDMQRLDPEWRAIERIRAQAALREVANDTREMAAAAWTEAEVRKLDDTARKEFAEFFSKARGTLLAIEIARAAGSELAGKAPHLSAPGQRDLQVDDVVPERVQSYFEGRVGAGHPEPPLSELRAANERLSAHRLRLHAARTAAIELASEAFASLMPATERPLVNAFVQGLSSSLARGALNEVVPARVADVQGAKDWIRTNVHAADPAAKVSMPHSWQFNVASLEHGTVAGVRNSELLLAALVARLQMQQTILQQTRAARAAAEAAARVASPRPRRVFFRW